MHYASLDGEVFAKIPVQVGPLAKFYVFMRNLLFSSRNANNRA